jgi:predicted RNase H-like nuclease (RuvC/YqgF family)
MNPDRREDGRRHIETRISGYGVPNIPLPPPPPPPPARPAGELEATVHFGTTSLRDQQEQVQRRMGQQQPVDLPPVARAIERLYEKTEELKGENEELKGQVDALVDNIKKLNSFVRATLDFVSNEEHSADFMRNHIGYFLELLKKNGLSIEKEEKKEESKDNSIRGDIANRLNNIQ